MSLVLVKNCAWENVFFTDGFQNRLVLRQALRTPNVCETMLSFWVFFFFRTERWALGRSEKYSGLSHEEHAAQCSPLGRRRAIALMACHVRGSSEKNPA